MAQNKTTPSSTRTLCVNTTKQARTVDHVPSLGRAEHISVNKENKDNTRTRQERQNVRQQHPAIFNLKRGEATTDIHIRLATHRTDVPLNTKRSYIKHKVLWGHSYTTSIDGLRQLTYCVGAFGDPTKR